MIYLVLYILSVLVVGIGFFFLNTKIKWLTQSDFEGYNNDFVWMGLIFGLLFWPIAIIVILIMIACTAIKEYLIPKD